MLIINHKEKFMVMMMMMMTFLNAYYILGTMLSLVYELSPLIGSMALWDWFSYLSLYNEELRNRAVK